VVPEKSIWVNNEPLSKFGFEWDWTVPPPVELMQRQVGAEHAKVGAVGQFLKRATTADAFRFARETGLRRSL
jgi:hypothetical protein